MPKIWVRTWLRWHVCRVEFARKIFFELRIFLRKRLRNFPPKLLSLSSVGQKKSQKIPSKVPTKFSKFPCEKNQKNSATSFYRSAGRTHGVKPFCLKEFRFPVLSLYVRASSFAFGLVCNSALLPSGCTRITRTLTLFWN